MRAIWNGVTLAESDQTVVVEGNHYFPPESLNRDALVGSHTTSTCPFKGNANYVTAQAGGAVNADAGWYYPQPNPGYEQIAGHVAFWRGVEVVP
jgi:uncharacterized protein (DUF427 family)